MKKSTKKTIDSNPDVVELLLRMYDAMDEERIAHDACIAAYGKRKAVERKLRTLVIAIRKTNEEEATKSRTRTRSSSGGKL